LGERHTHISAAATNYRLGKKLASTGGAYLYWVPTFAFYAAVQLIEARCADDGEHNGEHGNRLTAVYHYSSGPSGSSAYRKLQERSSEWRYHARTPTAAQVDEAWRWASDIAANIGETWPPT
jgi:hypothetical protein